MTRSATVRVMSAEEIAARAGGETSYFQWPARDTLFAERGMRLTQLARGHALGDYLGFVGALAQLQQRELKTFGAVPLPDAAALDLAAQQGVPPLAATDWPRDPAWHGTARALAQGLLAGSSVPEPARDALQRLVAADDVFLERQADGLLHGLAEGVDLATAPVVAGALQVYWTHMLLEVQKQHVGLGQPFGRLDDPGVCPCCGSRPVASITRTGGESLGQRYLVCSMCSLQWYLVRGKCSRCGSEKSLGYLSLDVPGAEEASAQRAAQAVVQAETCDDCGHYLKIVHTDRDPFVDPVADDLATLTLDLLVAEEGKVRHGINPMLLFGPSDPPGESG